MPTVHKNMDIDKDRITNIILLMVEQGVLEPVPEGIKFKNYKEMVKTSKGKNWTPPTRKQIKDAIEATELEDTKHEQIEQLEIELEKEFTQKYSLYEVTRILLGQGTTQERQELENMFIQAQSKKDKKVKAIEKAKSKAAIKKEKWL